MRIQTASQMGHIFYIIENAEPILQVVRIVRNLCFYLKKGEIEIDLIPNLTGRRDIVIMAVAPGTTFNGNAIEYNFS